MDSPKIFAFYLPQYHVIPENDNWWGKNFTDWINVKQAQPLFKRHDQPRIPLNNYYYDLLDPNTLCWQVDLAKKYNIDGFCFYHYWFNGKLLLEKPLSIFLNNKSINISFCFSWANEPWTRSWDGKQKDIIMPQLYEGTEDIVAHFNYVLPFFLDSRYLRIDNKPVFLLYRTESITYLSQMITLWNKLAKEQGFNGIYFVEELTSFTKKKYSNKTSAIVYMEPMYTFANKNFFCRLLDACRHPITRNKIIDYESVWKKVLKNENLNNQNWAGAFLDWDNTPRKKSKYIILKNKKNEIFSKYFSTLYNKTKKNNCPFIFINAWNEWAEGTYLEPDKKNKYFFLHSISECILNTRSKK